MVYCLPVDDATGYLPPELQRAFEEALLTPASVPRDTCRICGAPLARSNKTGRCLHPHSEEELRRVTMLADIPADATVPKTAEELVQLVSSELNVPREDFDKHYSGAYNKKARAVAIATYLLRLDLGLTFEAIGAAVGKRSNRTMCATHARMEYRLKTDRSLVAQVNRVRLRYPKKRLAA